MRYRLDRRVERRDGGRVVLGGDPLRVLRLSASGAAAVERWRTEGVERDGASTSTAALVDRFLAASLLQPIVMPASDADLAGLVVVVPVRDRVDALDRCLAALARTGVGRVVVVDDASADPAAHRLVAEQFGASFVTRRTRGGPSASRMTGWSTVMAGVEPAEFVAFVDSDIVVTPDCWRALLGHFADPAVGLVAPRVAHLAGAGRVDRYEMANSPLDLGPDPAPIIAGTRVAYVPAAALVVRASAFADIGGFDEAMEVGEDVDLVWRLADAGWRCRYEPASSVAHSGRTALAAMLRRRYDYGRSAAELDARHPGALPPVRGSRWSAAVVALAASGHPGIAAGVAAWTVRAMAAKLDALDDAPRLAARLVVRGHVGFAEQVARASVRPWFPITLLLAMWSRRIRRLAILGVLAGPVLAWRERSPALALPTWIAMWLADDLAYSLGVWVGSARRRTLGPLTPDL